MDFKKFLFSGLLVLLFALLFGCDIPVCGDNICNSSLGETQYNCQIDCGGAVPEDLVRAVWKSAVPWGITDWVHTGTSLKFVIQNNSPEPLFLTAIQIAPDKLISGAPLLISSGASQVAEISGLDCTPGGKYVYSKENIIITYNSANIDNKSMAGVADIVGNCGTASVDAQTVISDAIKVVSPSGTITTSNFTLMGSEILDSFELVGSTGLDAKSMFFLSEQLNRIETLEIRTWEDRSELLNPSSEESVPLQAIVVCKMTAAQLDEELLSVFDTNTYPLQTNGANYCVTQEPCCAVIFKNNSQ